MSEPITLIVDGAARTTSVEAGQTLLGALHGLGVPVPETSCDTVACGACTVLVDGVPTNACTSLAIMRDGCEITTTAGLSHLPGLSPETRERLDAVREALQETSQETSQDDGATRCGTCTPEVLLAVAALLARMPEASEDDVREALVGDLDHCRDGEEILRLAAGTAPRG